MPYVNLRNENTKKTKFIGYCRLHKGVMTVTQVKTKQCLSKQCHHFCKYKQHPYWEMREKIKLEKKKEKRELYD